MRYAVKFRPTLEEPQNFTITTWQTAGPASEAPEIAARLMAMWTTLVLENAVASGTVEEIIVSPDSGGAGQLAFPTGSQVNPFIEAYNRAKGLPAGTNTWGASFADVPVTGVSLNATPPQVSMLPKGTSTLIIEQPASGPKGRLYLPHPPAPFNTPSGVPQTDYLTGVRGILAVYYGFFSGTPELPKVFGVRSLSGFSLTNGLRASEKWSHLKSRAR